jgi:hypothetical protein
VSSSGGRVGVVADFRFWAYRQLISFFEWLSFRSQRVPPLVVPPPGTVTYRPYAESFPDLPLPGLFDPLSFPADESAEPRLRRIRRTTTGLAATRLLCPARTRPVPDNEQEYLRAVWPWFFQRAWPHPPHVVDGLDGGDLVAELAVRGPYASYLRKSGSGEYEFDLTWMLAYPAAAGLARPGGRAVLHASDGRLRTVRVDGSQPALLAALNEDLTTFRHNISVHLAMLTPAAIAATNELSPAHPVRRLLHHCFHTVLIGNREIGTAQLPGRHGFSARIFSHDHEVLARMAGDYLASYDFWDFEPPTQFERHGSTDTPFAYPYRDNILQLWAETKSYVDAYLGLYYVDDAAVRQDAEVVRWLAAFDGLITNGLRLPADGPTVDWLARLCATVIHVSTVEHDYLNNVTWNYSTLGWLIPTVVPSSGERMDRRRAFELIATLIGTWKPYNMLLTCDVPSLALDDAAREVMQDWIDRLALIQEKMTSGAAVDDRLSYPANLNPSVSN